MPRGVARVDANQPAMVAFLRRCGCLVEVLSRLGHGVPDLLVGTPRGKLILIELKCREGHGWRLTGDEQEWHRQWRRFPIFTVDNENDALDAIEHDCTAWDVDRFGKKTCVGCRREL